jgi:hypothetical protein
MNHAPAYIIRQGYKFERAKTPDAARTFRLWLTIQLAAEPQHREEILHLWDQGRAEARLR